MKPRKPGGSLGQTLRRCEGICCAGCHHYQVGADFDTQKIICWLDDRQFNKKDIRQGLIDADQKRTDQ